MSSFGKNAFTYWQPKRNQKDALKFKKIVVEHFVPIYCLYYHAIIWFNVLILPFFISLAQTYVHYWVIINFDQ